MIIKNAQYHKHPERGNVSILATIDEEVVSVPLDPNNRHYAEILKTSKGRHTDHQGR